MQRQRATIPRKLYSDSFEDLFPVLHFRFLGATPRVLALKVYVALWCKIPARADKLGYLGSAGHRHNGQGGCIRARRRHGLESAFALQPLLRNHRINWQPPRIGHQLLVLDQADMASARELMLHGPEYLCGPELGIGRLPAYEGKYDPERFHCWLELPGFCTSGCGWR